jgi:hypothetical protein
MKINAIIAPMTNYKTEEIWLFCTIQITHNIYEDEIV